MKFPPSTIIPPIEVACPSMYFVDECTIIFAPKSKGLHKNGVAKVLSTIKGMSSFFATFEILPKSKTSKVGFPIAH